MAISSLDSLTNAITSGRFHRQDWNKNFLPTAAAVAGEWHHLFRGTGAPGADSVANTGTNLAFQPLSYSTTNATGIYSGPDVGPMDKYLINLSAGSGASTSMPAVLMLVDLVGFYRVTTVTTTTLQSFTNTLNVSYTFTADASTDICTHAFYQLKNYTCVRLTTSGTLPAGLATATDYFVIYLSNTTCRLATSYANAVAGTYINITDAGTGTHNITTLLPRYTNGDRVRKFAYNTNATAMGAATPTLDFRYTNTSFTGSRATPATLPTCKSGAANGTVLYSGAGAGKYNPFVPLAAGDSGITSVESIQLSASYLSGEFSVMLCVPIVTIPMTTIGVWSERDCVNQMPSFPKIEDGACLSWLLMSGANTPTNTPYYGHLDMAWS
jgi:hypothetical protein